MEKVQILQKLLIDEKSMVYNILNNYYDSIN